MKNKHLEHPEDSILNEGKEGSQTILNFLKEKSSELSVKYDGAPAVVWGINPENNKFFVGTKSVFNKVKVKINYTHHDIELNHGHTPEVASILHMCIVSFQNYSNMGVYQGHTPNVASILHLCLEKLPRVKGVYQGDFIGFGGGSVYTPNTITYSFNDNVEEDMVFASHTSYHGDTMKDMIAEFNYKDAVAEEVKFLSTDAKIIHRDI